MVDPDLQIRGDEGGGGAKNKREPPGPLPLIRHWGFFVTGFGIVRDSLSTV